MSIICMYTCNYCQQLIQIGHLCSLEVCSVIPWQWYNILNQKNLYYKVQHCTTLYRFLHTSTKLSNAYIPLKISCCCLWLTWPCNNHHMSIKLYLSAECNLHITSGNHHHFTIDSSPSNRSYNSIKREQALQPR